MIHIQDLTKSYGSQIAVNHLNLDIQEGDLFGFIGPNGAGKTTTMKILVTLLKPTSGLATIGGHDVVRDRLAVRKIMGFMPDSMGMYDEMNVAEYLDFMAAMYYVPKSECKTLIADLLALVNFTKGDDRIIGTLSKGERQILALAKTLIHRPKVLILDEPAEGLDPQARIELRATLKELQRMGKTILISSHILTDLAELCNRFAIIEKGQLIIAGDTAAVLQQFQARKGLEIEIDGDPERAVGIVTELGAGFKAVVASPSRIEIHVEGGQEAVAGAISALTLAGVGVREVREKKVGLEDLFMQLTRGEVQ